MRAIPGFLFSLFAIATLNIANAQSALTPEQKTLDGWRAYKFGMTVDQARAVGGISWKKAELEVIKLTDKVVGRWWHMDSEKPQAIGGRNFQLRLTFKPDTGLHWIKFTHAGLLTNAADCQRAFDEALQDLERRHGVFSSLNPAQPEMDTGFGKRKVEVKSLPKSQSKYGLRTETVQLKPADPARTFLFAESLRTFGKAKISAVSDIRSSPEGCKLEIVYTDLD